MRSLPDLDFAEEVRPMSIYEILMVVLTVARLMFDNTRASQRLSLRSMSRHAPYGRASSSAWLIARANRKSRPDLQAETAFLKQLRWAG